MGLSAGAITVWFHRLYGRLGLKGCSSHSGRRTFVTELAKSIVSHGGSLRDVQQLAGHASLATTQRFWPPTLPFPRVIETMPWSDDGKGIANATSAPNLIPIYGAISIAVGNDNQAPQRLNVQARFTPDGFGIRAVVAVLPA
jgi:hypothetical protein